MQNNTEITIISKKESPDEKEVLLEKQKVKEKQSRNAQSAKGKKRRTSPDIILKNFWRQNEYFADLINAVVFEGEQVIASDMLTELDTDVSGIISMPEYEESLKRARDVVKKSALGLEFIVWGLENQQKVHYAMPLRTMIYDALGYLKEYQVLVKDRKRKVRKRRSEKRNAEVEKEMTREEFLSGIRREDRFHPQISIVLYYGEDKWDGPQTLEDMMVEMPGGVKRIFSDYHMNLVQVAGEEKYIFHNEDVKTVFEVASAILNGNMALVREKYSHEIKAELAQVIGAITASYQLQAYAEERENVNMCKSLENLMEQGRTEGREEGIQEGIQQGAYTKLCSMVAKKIAKGKTSEEIAEDLEEDLTEIQQIIAALEANG